MLFRARRGLNCTILGWALAFILNPFVLPVWFISLSLTETYGWYERVLNYAQSVDIFLDLRVSLVSLTYHFVFIIAGHLISILPSFYWHSCQGIHLYSKDLPTLKVTSRTILAWWTEFTLWTSTPACTWGTGAGSAGCPTTSWCSGCGSSDCIDPTPDQICIPGTAISYKPEGSHPQQICNQGSIHRKRPCNK